MNRNFTLTIFFFFSIFLQQQCILSNRNMFITTRGTQFILDGTPFYANGFNAYWLMYMASNLANPNGRRKVSETFRQAANRKLTVARTWAFDDGGSLPLQKTPGSYNEQMFKGLDYVVYTASKHGIKLILSFVNNYKDFGGKKQYVDWARSSGLPLNSEDDFFTSPIVKALYKKHINKILNRRNAFNGRIYKNDPTILAWELMNEPRCTYPCAAQTIQGWIKEMAGYVKSIDSNHLLEVGLEGFYKSTTKQAHFNPNNINVGTDFIANNLIPNIDFATLHAYPDAWLPNASDKGQIKFLRKWLNQHTADARRILRKPLLIAEFGKSRGDSGFTVDKRDELFKTVYSGIARSAMRNGPAAGALFWQLLAKGIESYGDGCAIFFEDKSSTVNVITRQSGLLYNIRRNWRRRARAKRDQRLAGYGNP